MEVDIYVPATRGNGGVYAGDYLSGNGPGRRSARGDKDGRSSGYTGRKHHIPLRTVDPDSPWYTTRGLATRLPDSSDIVGSGLHT